MHFGLVSDVSLSALSLTGPMSCSVRGLLSKSLPRRALLQLRTNVWLSPADGSLVSGRFVSFSFGKKRPDTSGSFYSFRPTWCVSPPHSVPDVTVPAPVSPRSVTPVTASALRSALSRMCACLFFTICLMRFLTDYTVYIVISYF